MSVISFPHGRRVPPKPTADTLADELTQLEIELARARLEQIRSEQREAEAQRWLKRILAAALLLWLAALAWPAKADSVSKSFYGRNGAFEGSSLTRGNSATYYNGAGRFSGSSVQHGGRTLYYNSQGRFSGSTITTSPRR